MVDVTFAGDDNRLDAGAVEVDMSPLRMAVMGYSCNHPLTKAPGSVVMIHTPMEVPEQRLEWQKQC